MIKTVFRNVFGSNGFMAYSYTQPQNVNIIVRLVGIVLLLAGLILLVGGVYLATLGGSWDYLLAGLGIVAGGARYNPNDRRDHIMAFALPKK